LICAASVLTEGVGSSCATQPSIWPAWKLCISYIRENKNVLLSKYVFTELQ